MEPDKWKIDRINKLQNMFFQIKETLAFLPLIISTKMHFQRFFNNEQSSKKTSSFKTINNKKCASSLWQWKLGTGFPRYSRGLRYSNSKLVIIKTRKIPFLTIIKQYFCIFMIFCPRIVKTANSKTVNNEDWLYKTGLKKG